MKCSVRRRSSATPLSHDRVAITGGWPRLLLRRHRQHNWVPRSFAVCAKGRVPRTPAAERLRHPFVKRNLRPTLVDSHGPNLTEKIEAVTAPAPLFRRFDQPSLHRIAMHIPQLLEALPRRPDIKVVEARLPECAPKRLVPKQFALARIAPFALG